MSEGYEVPLSYRGDGTVTLGQQCHVGVKPIVIDLPGRPDRSVGNLETFGRWDVSSNPGAATRTGIFPEKKYICPTTSGRRLIIRYYTKFDFTVDEGKERLNPSREEN